MTGAEATGLGNLVMGCCLIAGVSCCVLYDSRATHSFVSDSYVKRLGLPLCKLQCELAVSTPASGLVTTSSLCARSSGGRGTQVQGKSNLPASARLGSDLRDGLALCQSRSYRLPGEEVVVSRFRGSRVGVPSGGGEGDSEWRAVLHNLRPYGGGREREIICHTCGT